MRETREQSLPGALNLSFVEGLYADYLRDPESVTPEWRVYFDNLGNGDGAPREATLGPSFRPFSLFNPPNVTPGGASSVEPLLPARAPQQTLSSDVKQERVDQLIR